MSSSDDMTNHTVGATEEVSSAPVESSSGENASSLLRRVENGQTAGFSGARRALAFYTDDDQASSSARSAETLGSNRNSLLSNNSANHRHAEAHLHDFRAENRRNQAPSQLYNWQGTKTTIKERFAFLFNNEILSDVRFIVGRGTQQQRIPAHKLVLSSSSAVFDAMFNGTLATASAEIEVPDVEPSAFLAVLLFLYTDEIEIDPETVMTTLYTAKKYAVSPLEKHCVDYLRSNLTSDNAFLLLTQARLFDEPQLAAVCLNTIDKFTNDALNADGFTDIDIDTLIVVLERDTLRIHESKIFQAVSRWSEAECIRQQLRVTPENQRSVLGRALSLVRFPLMSIEEFAMGPAQSGLLTDREIVSLFLYFTVNPKPSIEFEAVSRCRIMGTPLTICRFQHSDRDNRWSYNGMSDSIRFSVDRKIFLVGYGVYGSYYGSAEYDVVIELSHVASGKIVASNSTGFNSDGSCYTFRLMFKEPVEICANMLYTASATFNGPDSHCGIKGMRRVTVDCDSGKSNKITFQFFAANGDTNGTSVDDGQIPELIFYV